MLKWTFFISILVGAIFGKGKEPLISDVGFFLLKEGGSFVTLFLFWLGVVIFLHVATLFCPYGVLSKYLVTAGCVATLSLSVFFANYYLFGWYVIIAGLALNTLVVVANGGMPVNQEAAQKALLADEAGAFSSSARHHQETDKTRLRLFCDWIYEPILICEGVCSIGDICIWGGFIIVTIERLLGS